jgi:hypothetical protein
VAEIPTLAHQLGSRHISETTENQSERSRVNGGLGRHGGDGESLAVGAVDGQTVDWKRMTAAKRPKPEPTQSGNPHCLTMNQHVLPKASIQRFSGSDGLVDVRLLRPSKRIRKPPSDAIFCAQRAWDQRAEHGYGKQIEDAFQEVGDRIVTTGVLAEEDHVKLTQFWFLWKFRAGLKENPMEDVKVPGVPALVLTKDAHERFELNRVLTVGLNGKISGRSMAGIQMQAKIAAASREKFRWGVVRASGGEFAVPDTFQNLMVLPVTPDICAAVNHPDGTIPQAEVSLVNQGAVGLASRYVFARNLDCCPGVWAEVTSRLSS